MDWPKVPFQWDLDINVYKAHNLLHTQSNTFISIPFTWQLPKVKESLLSNSKKIITVGGPAVKLMPNYLKDVAIIGSDYPGVLQMVNPEATKTSLGCPRNCPFCGANKIEPIFKELKTWPIRRVICDNNLLACSRKHFDSVIDKLKMIKSIDFQGLDCRLLTQYHANRIAELDVYKLGMVRGQT